MSMCVCVVCVAVSVSVCLSPSVSVYACQRVCIEFVYVCSTHRGHKSSGLLQAHPGEGERMHMVLGKA